MKALKIFKSMIDHLDLLLHHRHPPGKTVMLPDLPGQFIDFGICYRLADAGHILAFLSSGKAGGNHTYQGNATGDQRHRNGFRHRTPPYSIPSSFRQVLF